MESFRVIIAGCRDFTDYNLLCQICDHMLSEKVKTHKVIVVSGHATGADALGEKYAKERGFILETYPAEWTKYGKQAGPKRNLRMAEVSNALVAFWDGKSRGTKNMIDLANMKGIPVKVVRIDVEKEVKENG